MKNEDINYNEMFVNFWLYKLLQKLKAMCFAWMEEGRGEINPGVVDFALYIVSMVKREEASSIFRCDAS